MKEKGVPVYGKRGELVGYVWSVSNGLGFRFDAQVSAPVEVPRRLEQQTALGMVLKLVEFGLRVNDDQPA